MAVRGSQKLFWHVAHEEAIRDRPADAVQGDWVSAPAARKILIPALRFRSADTICERAYAGLIQARCRLFLVDDERHENYSIPKMFWWAEGHAALKANWVTGDFETDIEQEIRLRAFGVMFPRADIEATLPPDEQSPEPTVSPSAAVGGRKPADWWEDCLIDLAFQHFRGDLKPKSQADVIRAMQAWMTERGFDAADSTVKLRARKLMDAIERESEAEN